MFKIKTTGWLQ